MKRLRGFTVMEIMVVAAIIVILVAILTPVYFRAQAAARQTTCTVQLKQLAFAINLYMGDNDDRPPIDFRVLPESKTTCPRFGRPYQYNGAYIVGSANGQPIYATGFDPSRHAIVKCLSHHFWTGPVENQLVTVRNDKGQVVHTYYYSVPILPEGVDSYQVFGVLVGGSVVKTSSSDDWQTPTVR